VGWYGSHLLFVSSSLLISSQCFSSWTVQYIIWPVPVQSLVFPVVCVCLFRVLAALYLHLCITISPRYVVHNIFTVCAFWGYTKRLFSFTYLNYLHYAILTKFSVQHFLLVFTSLHIFVKCYVCTELVVSQETNVALECSNYKMCLNKPV